MSIKTLLTYTSIAVYALTLKLCLHFVKTDLCTGAGTVVGDFFGMGGGGVDDEFSHWIISKHSTIFFFCLDDSDDFDF